VRRFRKRPAPLARSEMERNAGKSRRTALLERLQHTELIENRSCFGRDKLSADLMPGKRGLLEQAYRPPFPAGGNGGRGASRSAADDFNHGQKPEPCDLP